MVNLRYEGPRGSGFVSAELLSSGNVVIAASDWNRIAGREAPVDSVRFAGGGGEPRPFMGGAVVVVPRFVWRINRGADYFATGAQFSYREALRAAIKRANDVLPDTELTVSVMVFHAKPRPVSKQNQMPESEMIYLETVLPGERAGIGGRLYPCNACGAVETEKP